MDKKYSVSYEWRVLSTDGLLKSVPLIDRGTRYYKLDGKFPDKTSAYSALEEYLSEAEHLAEDNLVLVKTHNSTIR